MSKARSVIRTLKLHDTRASLRKRQLNMRKAVRFCVVINAVQILMMVAVAIVVSMAKPEIMQSGYMRSLLVLVTVVAVWGATMDIREALQTRREAMRTDMIQDALAELESLNVTLRAQRHDFMNHLQVVYSLMELCEYAEAMDYIKTTFNDIQQVSQIMRTASPAINALIMAKQSDCQTRGIDLNLSIASQFKDLPIESWEMCRILGNLLDNAMDALSQTPHPAIWLELTEDLHAYKFSVANNGPAIPVEHRTLIFEVGFTTKPTGSGMGLHIVRNILRDNSGDITLSTQNDRTIFAGFLPKPLPESHSPSGTPVEISADERAGSDGEV